MRPSTDPEFLNFLATEERLDPIAYKAEYGSQFRDDLESYLKLEALEAVTVTGRTSPPYVQGAKFAIFADMASGAGSDSAALAVGTLQNGKAVLCRVVEFKPSVLLGR